MEEEVLIDPDVRSAFDENILGWDGVSTGTLHGGVSYNVAGATFAVLLEGVIAARLPDALRSQAFGLAGVSPFQPPDGDDGYAEWVQMVILLPDGVPDVVPWIRAAYEYASGDTPGGT
ncbi:MAG: hypothetical protein IIC83_13185 [Chloroflexi bacterium]|nr:hypothetical protein [Chloroflexota bacterium]